MKSDKTIEHGMLLVKLLINKYPHGNEIDTFPSLDVLRVFKTYFVLGDTMYNNILRNLRAFEIISMVNYNEITFNKTEFRIFCKEKQNENEEADKRFKELIGK